MIEKNFTRNKQNLALFQDSMFNFNKNYLLWPLILSMAGEL